MNPQVIVSILLVIVGTGCESTTNMPSKTDNKRFTQVAYMKHADEKAEYRFCDMCPLKSGKTQPELPAPIAITSEHAVIVGQDDVTTQRSNVEGAPGKLASKFIVNFALNSSSLDDDAHRVIGELLAHLARRTEVSEVEIHGYTDDIGTNAYNAKLALSRALAVSHELRAAGVKLTISSYGEGECCFITENDSEDSRRLNRRSEVVFISTRR